MEEEAGKKTPETDSTSGNLMSESPIWRDDAMDFDLDEETLEELVKLLEDDIVAPHFPPPSEPDNSDVVANAKIGEPTPSEIVSSTVTNADIDDGISLFDLMEFTGEATRVIPSAENQPWGTEMEHLLWPVEGKIDFATCADEAGTDDEELRDCIIEAGELDVSHIEECVMGFEV